MRPRSGCPGRDAPVPPGIRFLRHGRQLREGGPPCRLGFAFGPGCKSAAKGQYSSARHADFETAWLSPRPDSLCPAPVCKKFRIEILNQQSGGRGGGGAKDRQGMCDKWQPTEMRFLCGNLGAWKAKTTRGASRDFEGFSIPCSALISRADFGVPPSCASLRSGFNVFKSRRVGVSTCSGVDTFNSRYSTCFIS